MSRLTWLPVDLEWREKFAALDPSNTSWSALRALANCQVDFLQTSRLDRRLTKLPTHERPEALRLALLSSCTVDHLLPSLRIAALRRNIWLDIYLSDYGQFRQSLLDPDSGLASFEPQAVIFAIDAKSLVGAELLGEQEGDQHVSRALEDLVSLWRVARSRYGAQVIQQTVLPTFPYILGSAEHRARSPASMANIANERLRQLSIDENVDLLSLDSRVQRDGLDSWHNAALWNRAKQEISPAAAPMFGELAVRVLAAQRGRSAKCLVIDLDNTIWGGVVGDDGVEGIVLGEGSANGEAFLEFQRFVKALSKRGIIVAVCSKNDEANAVEAFEKHPDMILKQTDIAVFLANWDDKATNLRRIAAELNIGIDALVFADDNPFERNIVRRELPEVFVPELPEDPTMFGSTIADAGYFEAIGITLEDFTRNASYQVARSFRERDVSTSDVAGYLASLDMELVWGPFDLVSLKRVTQLINKTNQFNVATRRYTEGQITDVLNNPEQIGLHFRLVDRYADHGIIGVIIAQRKPGGVLRIDTWLMSCRVLGRGVELAALAILVNEARRFECKKILGEYRATAKNGMVMDLYARLGFHSVSNPTGSEVTCWELDVSTYQANAVKMVTKEIAK